FIYHLFDHVFAQQAASLRRSESRFIVIGLLCQPWISIASVYGWPMGLKPIFSRVDHPDYGIQCGWQHAVSPACRPFPSLSFPSITSLTGALPAMRTRTSHENP
ncbi:hypothetical protein Q4595_20335, partial [Wenyingzhuangia sp. 1_MG-2023]|nr:hypothetical protein [Wenyingzhuangia sp. 1_MG-2023]